jgi:hypothetical protein
MVMIVLKGLNVRDAVSNVLANFANALGSAVIVICHEDLSIISSDAAALRGPLRCALVRVRWPRIESTPMAETSVATNVHQALFIVVSRRKSPPW